MSSGREFGTSHNVGEPDVVLSIDFRIDGEDILVSVIRNFWLVFFTPVENT